jgi:cobalamin-dependent methionine synthase I
MDNRRRSRSNNPRITLGTVKTTWRWATGLSTSSTRCRKQFDAALKAEQWDEALQLGTSLVNQYANVVDPKLLTGMAVHVAESEGPVPDSLLELALDAAQRAVVATRFEAPGMLDALASAFARQGNMLGAALAEMRAISVSEGEMKNKQEERLAGFLDQLGVAPATTGGMN